MTKTTQKTKPAETQDETVEITFDFSKVDLFDFLDVLEYSANASGPGAARDPAAFAKFLRVVRSAYVSSSRPLTGNDFAALTGSFWESVKLGRDPNS